MCLESSPSPSCSSTLNDGTVRLTDPASLGVRVVGRAHCFPAGFETDAQRSKLESMRSPQPTPAHCRSRNLTK